MCVYVHAAAEGPRWGDVFRNTEQYLGRGDDTVGNPQLSQIAQFEFFELIFSLKLHKRFPIEQLEATVSQSRVPSPLFVSHVLVIVCLLPGIATWLLVYHVLYYC